MINAILHRLNHLQKPSTIKITADKNTGTASIPDPHCSAKMASIKMKKMRRPKLDTTPTHEEPKMSKTQLNLYKSIF